MSKQSYFLLALIFCFLLNFTGCAKKAAAPATAIPSETHTIPQTQPPTTGTPPTTTTPTATPVPTTPEHSELYIPGLDVDDVIRYFNEVCLDAEYVNSGNPSLLQKWDVPITYWINGSTTTEDLAQLQGMVNWLNALEGFPGIRQVEEAWQANMTIHFCSQQELISILGNQFYGTDGGVTFWYDGNNRIYDAIICYRTDLNQQVRNSVILEEIYNGLGPIQDTQLRTDSIIYAGYSEPQALTQVDELLLKLLYCPDLHCGMTAEECEAVIRQLYY